jgi:hypothetical protein
MTSSAEEFTSDLTTLEPLNPKNREYPEIVTVTEANERVDATEEHKLTYETGAPKGTIVVKKVSVIHTRIRTTTPYTGTV